MALLSVIGAWSQLRRERTKDRDRLKQDLEIVNMLPEHSHARAWLLSRVDLEIRQLAEAKAESSRDPLDIGLRLSFIGMMLLFFLIAVTRGGSALWFLAVALICGIAATVGLRSPRSRNDQ